MDCRFARRMAAATDRVRSAADPGRMVAGRKVDHFSIRQQWRRTVGPVRCFDRNRRSAESDEHARDFRGIAALVAGRQASGLCVEAENGRELRDPRDGVRNRTRSADHERHAEGFQQSRSGVVAGRALPCVHAKSRRPAARYYFCRRFANGQAHERHAGRRRGELSRGRLVAGFAAASDYVDRVEPRFECRGARSEDPRDRLDHARNLGERRRANFAAGRSPTKAMSTAIRGSFSST